MELIIGIEELPVFVAMQPRKHRTTLHIMTIHYSHRIGKICLVGLLNIDTSRVSTGAIQIMLQIKILFHLRFTL